MMRFLFIILSVLTTSLFAQNTKIKNFRKAKKILPQIYSGNEKTIYCGCKYKVKKVDHASCGYVPIKNYDRAKRIEWEHIVSAHGFGQSFESWRNGHTSCKKKNGKTFRGRKCARKVSKEFNLIEGDMYNLTPAIGEVNDLRANYLMAMLPGEPRKFGKCDVEISDKQIEPRPEIRGDIARIYFYMDHAYPNRGIISEKNRKLFVAWAKEDPVDAWEIERAKKIAKIQGNDNIFVVGKVVSFK